MACDEGAIGREVEKRVVDGSTMALALLHADNQPYVLLTCYRTETIGRRAGDDDRVLREHAEPVTVAVPDWSCIDPDRGPGDKDFGNTTTCAPSFAAALVSWATRSIVASRSM